MDAVTKMNDNYIRIIFVLLEAEGLLDETIREYATKNIS